jgi:radical SAM protein with 4Fe4S-binding SPASM domain
VGEELTCRELFLQLHVTSRCNLRCTHCYAEGGARDMSPELFRRTLDAFDELRALREPERCWVQITGGEPLVHPSFAEFLKEAALRFPVKVLTNGTLVGREEAEFLAAHCLSVQVSFDGLEAEHDRVRGPGAFGPALEGLTYLREAGCRTVARMTVTESNVKEAIPLLDLLQARIDAFCVSRVVPMGGCRELLPPTDAYRELIYALYGKAKAGAPVAFRDPFFGPLLAVDRPHDPFSGCSAGVSNVCVTETGDVMPCRRLPIVLGNLATAGLAEVWEGSEVVRALRERSLKGACGSCEDVERCAGSRCVAYALTGDPLAADSGCIFL